METRYAPTAAVRLERFAGAAPTPSGVRPATGLRRAALLVGAAVTFALAVAGAVLPGLPTTPFLLLTSYCLVRASPSLNRRLLRAPVFGPMLADWQTRRGVRPGVKTKAIGLIVVAVAATLWLSPLPAVAKAAVALLAACGVAVVASLRVLDRTRTALPTHGYSTLTEAPGALTSTLPSP